MMIYHLCSITLAYFLDKLVGDPPTWPHPVKWFGRMISFLEKRWNRGSRRKLKGFLLLVSMLLLVAGSTSALVWYGYHIHPGVGMVLEAILIAATIAEKSLKEAALEVYEPLENGDIEEARVKLSYIVGRDTDTLEEGEIVRGTVETVAENTSDGITAPLFWAFIGGAPLALVYRLVNTCDSMVGYKNERFMDFGFASAKLDDLLNLIPSRLTGFFMLLMNQPKYFNWKQSWGILVRDARRHPSPNSGWGEAAVAALLGIQLGGINYYKGIISIRAKMGEPMVDLEREHIMESILIMERTVFLFILFLWIGGIFIDITYSWL
ncbi:adenosylcobinamide-phosphate synthase CbiB [Cytobacillus sp. Hz8]|uniref:adenosylcobinamide-phosphate synthase CbiB n=1 Tax=Cytobacillus sp. Hz8 TaxID=3347168 RepID=UPI0035DCD976